MVILILQMAPLILFPASVFTLDSQVWWLPALLIALVGIALTQIIIRHSTAQWPWHLIAFAQGFNIISRLMMLLPHTTKTLGNHQVFDAMWVVFSLVSMALSVAVLWYCELVEVRGKFIS